MLRLGLASRMQMRSFSSSRALTATHRDLQQMWNKQSSGWNRSRWGWLRKPLLFAAGVVAFDYFVLPKIIDSAPLAPIRRHPEFLVYGIIGLNTLGFALWRLPQTSKFMYRYGLLQKTSRDFNSWQMIGSAFSHQNFWHLAINMFVLYQFGTTVSRWMGASTFLESYIDGCVLSSLGSIVLPLLARQVSYLPSLGASGAVFGAFGTFCYLAPHARLALWFIPLPIGAWWVFLATVGYNAAAMVGRFGGGMDYAGHVAGSLVGIAYGYIVTDRMRRAREYRMKRMGW